MPEKIADNGGAELDDFFVFDNTTTPITYVDGVNGNDSNDGFASDKALKTIQAALNQVNNRHVLIPHEIHIADGIYPEYLTLQNIIGQVALIGNTSDKTAVNIIGCHAITNNDTIIFQWITLTDTENATPCVSAASTDHLMLIDVTVQSANYSMCVAGDKTYVLIQGNSKLETDTTAISINSGFCRILTSEVISRNSLAHTIVTNATFVYCDKYSWDFLHTQQNPYLRFNGGQVIKYGLDVNNLQEKSPVDGVAYALLNGELTKTVRSKTVTVTGNNTQQVLVNHLLGTTEFSNITIYSGGKRVHVASKPYDADSIVLLFITPPASDETFKVYLTT
jgi:hypothetical protein